MIASRNPLVLCFHSVSGDWRDALAVTPGEFERHIVGLLRHGYEPTSASNLLTRRGKLLHVTFDDAFASVMDAADVLERLGVPSTVFVCSSYSERGRQSFEVPELALARRNNPSEFRTLGWKELRQLAERGIEIGSHGVAHAHLTRLDDARLREELESSRRRIEDELARPCRFLAYPYGENDLRVREAARKAGYKAAFGLPGDRSWSDPFELSRVGIWRGERPLRVRLKASRIGPFAARAKAVTGGAYSAVLRRDT